MTSVEPLVLPLAPASHSPSPVTLHVRMGASVMMVLSSTAISVCHQHLVDVIMKDAIGKVGNSSGMVKSARACALVMA